MIEAMKQALEALEDIVKWYGVRDKNDVMMPPLNQNPEIKESMNAITALRQAIAEAEKQEPVAWMNKHGACKTSLFREVEAGAKDEYTIPLYTHPPKREPVCDRIHCRCGLQREWVGLTDEDELDWDGGDLRSLVKAIEANLREKNT